MYRTKCQLYFLFDSTKFSSNLFLCCLDSPTHRGTTHLKLLSFVCLPVCLFSRVVNKRTHQDMFVVPVNVFVFSQTMLSIKFQSFCVQNAIDSHDIFFHDVVKDKTCSKILSSSQFFYEKTLLWSEFDQVATHKVQLLSSEIKRYLLSHLTRIISLISDDLHQLPQSNEGSETCQAKLLEFLDGQKRT